MTLTALHRIRTALFAILALAALAATPAFAGPEEKTAKTVVAPEPETRVHFLFNFEFSNEYVTPRGMLVRDEGLTIQPLFLTLANLYKSDGFLSDVTLVLGCWNDFGTSGVSKHPPFGSDPKTPWTEIDPIAGLSFGLGKQLKLDVTYTAFAEQILDIGTSQHLEVKLSLDDSPWLKAFALHPYFSFWQELDGKATDADVPFAVFGPNPHSGNHPQPGSSYYFDIGIAPSYTFANVLGGLKFEAPCRVLLPNERFYGEYYKSASTVGLFEVGLKASLPLNFMPKGYGHWSFHTGFKYMNFVDDNLYNLNTFNAPGKPTRDTWQAYGGISIFF
ncbi:MAG TPA: hypothetical protein VEO95_03765 [Chthoniobacteraceae bacterium]|nr:hypothetical protein [Chthoniobacteraceae bacterium]